MVENLFLIHNLNFLCSNLRPLLLVLSKVDTENRLFLSSLLLHSAYQSVLFYILSSHFFSSNPVFSSEVMFSRTLLILLVLFCNFSYKHHFIVIQCSDDKFKKLKSFQFGNLTLCECLVSHYSSFIRKFQGHSVQ